MARNIRNGSSTNEFGKVMRIKLRLDVPLPRKRIDDFAGRDVARNGVDSEIPAPEIVFNLQIVIKFNLKIAMPGTGGVFLAGKDKIEGL